MSREQFLRSKGVDTTSVTAPTVRRQDVDVQGRRIGTTGGMSNGREFTPASSPSVIAANRLEAANTAAATFGGAVPSFQSDYDPFSLGWREDEKLYHGTNTHNAAVTNGWTGTSAFTHPDTGLRQEYYQGVAAGGSPTLPYPTVPNNNGPGGGGGYYGGGQSLAQRQAAWDKYQKEYLAMIAGFSPTQVGPAPVDDLTPLVNTAVDADVAHVAAAYGGVVPMDANAYQTTSRATTPSAAMYGGGLMDGQGFDAASARQNQVRRQGELNADAYLWDEHWDAESARTGQFNSAWNADVETLGANAEALVQAQRASLLAAAGVKHQDQMDVYERERIAALNADTRRKEEAAMALLQQGLASGMDLGGLDLSQFIGGA